MADHSRSFQDTLAQLGGEDFLRDLTEFMLNRIMEADVAQRINADRHERTDERETYRNGFRDRQFNTRLRTLDLRIPKLREGMYFPPFLEARRLSEKSVQSGYSGSRDKRRLNPQGGCLGAVNGHDGDIAQPSICYLSRHR